MKRVKKGDIVDDYKEIRYYGKRTAPVHNGILSGWDSMHKTASLW